MRTVPRVLSPSNAQPTKTDAEPGSYWLMPYDLATWAEQANSPVCTYSVPRRFSKNAKQISTGDVVVCYVGKVGFVAAGVVTGPGLEREVDVLDADGNRSSTTVVDVEFSITDPALLDLREYVTSAPPFQELFESPELSGTPANQRGQWVRSPARRLPDQVGARLRAAIAKASEGGANTRLLDPRLGDSPERRRRHAVATSVAAWAASIASVVPEGGSMPLTEAVRRLRTQGARKGGYEVLLTDAETALAATTLAAPVNGIYLDGGHVHHLAAAQGGASPEADGPTDPLGSLALQDAIDAHRRAVKRELLYRLMSMDSYEFENYVCRVLAAAGIEDAQVTQRFSDGGVDITGKLRSAGTITQPLKAQVKRWSSNVGRPTIQQMRGTLVAGELGLVVTTSDFSSEARADATATPGLTPVSLINGAELAELALDNEIGVRRQGPVHFEVTVD